jgi:hypothetical protein
MEAELEAAARGEKGMVGKKKIFISPSCVF